MSAIVRTVVEKCKICRSMDKRQHKEPLQSLSIPTCPWAKLAVDLFHIDDQDFIAITDYYSKFVKVECLHQVIGSH